MIISENRKPSLSLFKDLMTRTDVLLNIDATERVNYYSTRSGKDIEVDVYNALCEASRKTEFEGTIQLISGATFPDIVAHKFYGVEVKTTIKNHWTSIGSSILESTRNADVERIYLTFGKLGKPIQFLSRPYEECLSGIAVTHYPRYQIDMNLEKGETIFDKMGISYDELRIMDNPVVPVSKYYKAQLKPGESLWWAANDVDSTVPPTIKLWTALTHQQKEALAIQGYALFPEILAHGSNKKYNRYALWLASKMGVVNTNIRDSFSAGGKVELPTQSGVMIKMPAAFGRIQKYSDLIQTTIDETDKQTLMEYWEVDGISDNRIRQWCRIVASAAASSVGYDTAWNVLSCIFPQIELSGSNTNVKLPGEKIVVCRFCGEYYRQYRTRQLEGHRFSEDDICPYCNNSNGSSLEWEFNNHKL